MFLKLLLLMPHLKIKGILFLYLQTEVALHLSMCGIFIPEMLTEIFSLKFLLDLDSELKGIIMNKPVFGFGFHSWVAKIY